MSTTTTVTHPDGTTVTCTTATPPPVGCEMEAALVGAWSLTAFDVVKTNDAAVVAQPFGPSPVGQLVYTDNNRMNGMMMKSEADGRSLSEPKGEGELAAAFLSVISYCGSWTVDAESETVTHHVSAATYPNWVNTSQARGCKLDGDTLELSTDEGCPPGCSSVIRWARQA